MAVTPEILERLRRHRKERYMKAALETFPKAQQTSEVVKNIEKAAEVFAADVKTETDLIVQIITNELKLQIPTGFATAQGPIIPVQ